MISFGSMAQNFKTFTIDGALTIGAIRSTGTVEVVVPADFDLTKCMVHYDLDAAAGVEIDAATAAVPGFGNLNLDVSDAGLNCATGKIAVANYCRRPSGSAL